MSEFAGTLNQRVELLRPTPDRTEAGLSLRTWERFARCLASVVPDGAGAESEGMSLSALPRFRAVIRMRRDVAVDHKLLWRGRPLLIKQIIEDPRTPDRMQLRCEEMRS